MTKQHKIQRTKRQFIGEFRRNSIWSMLAGMVSATVLMTAFGFMDWSGTTLVEAAPVNIEQAVDTCGLHLEGK